MRQRRYKKMFRIPTIVVLAFLVLAVGLVFAPTAQSAPVEEPPAGASVNKVVFDATYDAASEAYSLGGFSYEQLKAWGAPALNKNFMDALKLLGDAYVRVDGVGVELELSGTDVAYVDWDPASRLAMFDL